MIAPLRSTSEWCPRLKSAGDPVTAAVSRIAAGSMDLLAGFGRIGEIVRLRAHTQGNVWTWLLEFCRAAGWLSSGAKNGTFNGAFAMNAAVMKKTVVGLNAHPNEVDRKRIECALGCRKRYRYVSPSVKPVKGGYLIESPCCSREIDQDGRVIDVALIHHDAVCGLWKLFWKDHARGIWQFHSVHQRLSAVTDELNADLDRVFWR